MPNLMTLTNEEAGNTSEIQVEVENMNEEAGMEKRKRSQNWKNHSRELQQQAYELIHDIGKNFLDSPETIAELLAFGSRFYKYSANNVKLIYAQNPGVTYVQSFEAWKKMDAHVLKGEHGIKIFVPVKSTFLKLNDGKQVQLSEASPEQKIAYKSGSLEGFTRMHFKIGNVFDIAQTNFPKEKYPELYSMGDDSEQHANIVKGLEAFSLKNNVPVFYENLSSISRRGYYAFESGRIVINELLNDTQKLSTLTHEIGHVLEHHENRNISVAQMELEADCISVLIQSHLDLEINETRKKHLADHYRKYEEEIKATQPDISEEKLMGKLDEVLSASLKVFQNHIDSIQESVDAERKANKDAVRELQSQNAVRNHHRHHR